MPAEACRQPIYLLAGAQLAWRLVALEPRSTIQEALSMCILSKAQLSCLVRG
jgi:hypothetical protein